jgi:hypothetical protein
MACTFRCFGSACCLHLRGGLQLSGCVPLLASLASEVFTSATMKNAVSWDVASCGFITNRCFGGTCRLHLQSKRNNASKEKCRR